MDKDLEGFWREVLSGDPLRVREAIAQLSSPDREAVARHLKQMASEVGWSEGQRRRARAALEAMGSKLD